MSAFTFDVKFFAHFTVQAATSDEAEKLLNERLGYLRLEFAADVNADNRIEAGGAEPDGEHDLVEIDGEMT
ncbi:hypothetical protein [Hyphomicrobium sp.]|uniref:hypothetical protein n=1 Tax=Hyphomicrobium sp. TaxID=82 RepID=UPI001DF4F598|nr:hypothetical protein [Hyphomicrobium sp.]MBY0561477.1 hypothetical protein [Hyphomicrobium sp.]